MDFETFKKDMVNWMERMYPDVNFIVQTVVKNNGVELNGISGHSETQSISPVIYIDDLYGKVTNGSMSFAAAATIVENQYSMALEQTPKVNVEEMISWDYIKDRVYLQLVGCEMNQETLNTCPRELVGNDMVVICRVLYSKDEYGVASTKLNNEMFNRLNISENVLFEQALANTERLFPAKVIPLHEMIINMMLDEMSEQISDFDYEKMKEEMKLSFPANDDIYVVTNDTKINGATAILYPSVQKMVQEMMGPETRVLPSSVHEVLVLGNTELDSEMALLVREVNSTVVSREDKLSDSVYRIADGNLININQFDQAIEDALEEHMQEDFYQENNPDIEL